MSRTTIHITIRAILLTLLMSAGVSVGLGQKNEGGGRLAGTWNTVVTIRVCATGAPITSFQSVGSFNQGGTFSGITSGMPPIARTSERGVWAHVRANEYRFRFKAYLYNAAAEAIGYQIVTHDLELDEDNLNWASSGTSVTYNMAGVATSVGCSTAIGSRMLLD